MKTTPSHAKPRALTASEAGRAAHADRARCRLAWYAAQAANLHALDGTASIAKNLGSKGKPSSVAALPNEEVIGLSIMGTEAPNV